jgi:hypothetical protein
VLLTSLVSFHARLYIYAYKIRDVDKVSHLIFRHFEPSSIPSHAILLIVIPTLLSGPISCTVRSPYVALPFAFAAYWSGLVFFTLAYHLSSFHWHSLAKYPGPLLSKTSKWWAAYLGGTGDQHRCLKRLHDCYGDVRIGGNPHPPRDSALTPPLRRSLLNFHFPSSDMTWVLDYVPVPVRVFIIQICTGVVTCKGWKTTVSKEPAMGGEIWLRSVMVGCGLLVRRLRSQPPMPVTTGPGNFRH